MLNQPVETAQASIQTEEFKEVKLVMVDAGVQTDTPIRMDRGTTSNAPTVCSLGIQVDISDSVDSKLDVLPDTPSTCNGSLLQCYEELVAPRTTSAVSSSEGSDVEKLLECAMMSMNSSDEKPQTLDNHSLFVDIDWGSGSNALERFTTTDSFISGGSIYRTCSEPVPDTFDSNNYWSYGVSETLGSPLHEISEAYTDPDRSALESRVLSEIRPSGEFQAQSARMVSRMNKSFTGWVSRVSECPVSLIPYGSMASGLILNNGCVDLILTLPIEFMETHFSGSLSSPKNTATIPLHQMREYEMRQMMKKALTRAGEVWEEDLGITIIKQTGVGGTVTSNFGSMKLPSITIATPEGLVYEVSCNNLFPVFSTQLLKSYSGLFPNGEIRDFVLLVKKWASREIMQVSGFTLTLLAIFYCQVCRHLFPSLQALSPERRQWRDPFGSRRCDVSFATTCDEVDTSYVSPIDLFAGFIDFYANQWNWSSGVVSVRLGKIVSIDSPEILLRRGSQDKTRTLHVEDPFDSKKDIGTNANELFKAFQKTYKTADSSLTQCFE